MWPKPIRIFRPHPEDDFDPSCGGTYKPYPEEKPTPVLDQAQQDINEARKMCDAQEPKPIGPETLKFKSGGFVDPKLLADYLRKEQEMYLPRRPISQTEAFLKYLLQLHSEKQITYHESVDKDGQITVVFKRIKA